MRDSICNDCAKRTRCDMAEIGRSPLAISTCYGYEKGNPTNADKIRQMSDEELAAKIEELCQYTFMQISVYAKPFGKAEWLDWLKQEAKNV